MEHNEILFGGLAQLARALDLHSRGHRFDSDILHHKSLKIRFDGVYPELDSEISSTTFIQSKSALFLYDKTQRGFFWIVSGLSSISLMYGLRTIGCIVGKKVH